MKSTRLFRILAIAAATVLMVCSCGKDPQPGEEIPSGPRFETVEGSAEVYTIPAILNNTIKDFGFENINLAEGIPTLLALCGITDLGGLASIAAEETPYGTENIIYRTKDPAGKELWVSGRLYYTVDKEGNMVEPTHILLSSHHTIGSDAECPTNKISFESAYAHNGGLVLCPDFIGYGKTKDLAHPYCVPDLTASVNVDMLRAAKELLESRGFEGVFEKLDIYNIGYSQGGHAALATQKYIESDANLSKEFNLKKTWCGAGPYSVDKMLDSYAENNTCPLPGAIIMMMEGCRWVIADLANPDDTKWYSKAVLDKGIKEMVLSKNYTLDKINTAVHNATLGSFKGIFANWDNQKPLLELAAKKCSILNGDGWKPKTPVRFYHAPNDDTVPYFNQTNARTALGNVNTTFEDGRDVPSLFAGKLGVHTFNGVLFFAHNICGDYLNK